jgi:hypothetical protein
MIEDFFIVPDFNIDPNWSLIDLNYEVFALEYCEEVLEIPIVYIEYALYQGSGLEVVLKNLNNYAEIIQSDWYIQLSRLSSVANAA